MTGTSSHRWTTNYQHTLERSRWPVEMRSSRRPGVPVTMSTSSEDKRKHQMKNRGEWRTVLDPSAHVESVKGTPLNTRAGDVTDVRWHTPRGSGHEKMSN